MPTTVLIADDDPLIRRMLVELLSGEPGFAVAGAAAGADEAAQLAEQTQPDIALLDVQMPDGGGPAAARAIAVLAPETRVVAFSAFDEPSTVRSMLRAGAVTYAVKGASADELIGVLRRAAELPPGVPSPALEPAPWVERVGGEVSVLLIDADAEVLDALAEVIEGAPELELVGLAQVPSHAVSLAARHQPSVALLDTHLPSGGGERIAAEIAAASPATRIVAHSAHRDPENVVEMLRAGASSFVLKRADGQGLVHTILEAARGSAIFDEAAAEVIIRRLEFDLTGVAGSGRFERRRDRIERVLAGGELDIALQPICRLSDGEPIGYEALARFPGGSGGPDVWFGDAERVGLGCELERLAVSCALHRLHAVPPGAWMSINVSPACLLTDRLGEILAGAPGERIVLEITEHAAVDDYEALGRCLAHLRERGFRIAVDDCGAGFASLRHVVRLAPEFLKLDVVLGREVRAPAHAAMARALVGFGHELGATVIAEGVERAADRDALGLLGIGLAQGRLFSEPQLAAAGAT